MKPKALIFTKRVLPRSNTFVASQGNNLSKYQPIYIGLRHDSTGKDLIRNHAVCVQQDHEHFPALARLSLDGFQRLGLKWQRALEKHQASVLHANFGKGGYYCCPIAEKLNLPLITTFHGSDITQKDKFSYNSKHRQLVFDKSDKIIAVSKFIERKLLEKGCPENKVIQNYIGIDNEFFSPSTQKFERPTILFVGRLIEQKGCQYLLKAMRTINQRVPEAQLFIAGYGSFEIKLKNLAETLKNVTFLGAQDQQQVKELMSMAWVTCVPSIRMDRGNEEGLGIVNLESQAVGTPVVAFNTGGVNEAIIDKSTGLLSDEKDVGALTENLLLLLNSNELREELGINGIKRISECFSIKKQTQKLEGIYDSLL